MLGRKAPVFPSFRPRWPWIGGDLQTVRNSFISRVPDVYSFTSERLRLIMNDGSGDCLWGRLNRPSEDSAKPLVILVHGLTGSEDSPNIATSAAYHLHRGYPVLRLNLRGAAPGMDTATGHYHAGRSADIRDAIAALPPHLTDRGIVLIGVSLGGNICLKYLAETNSAQGVLAGASVCAPIDLKMAQQRIAAPRNSIYQRHLLRGMRAEALRQAKTDGIKKVISGIHTVYEFDDRIVAPANGFADAEDYYRRASAGPLLDMIQVPTLLVHAATDPWVPAHMYLDRSWPADCATTLLMAPDGGHVGFHAADSLVPWHDRCIGLFIASIRS